MPRLSPILEEYVSIKKQIAELEAKKDAIQDQVIEEIEENLEGGNEYKTNVGVFKLNGRRTYKYSQNIALLAEGLSVAKKKEEKDGTAELMKHSTFPVFIPKKD